MSTEKINDKDHKKRAITAAGSFCSGEKDISVKHDEYLTETFKDKY